MSPAVADPATVLLAVQTGLQAAAVALGIGVVRHLHRHRHRHAHRHDERHVHFHRLDPGDADVDESPDDDQP